MSSPAEALDARGLDAAHDAAASDAVDDAALAAAVRAHDGAVAALGVPIWLGGEPTFTDRFSLAPEWLSAALGGEKEPRARAFAARLAARLPGALVLRTLGRQYAGEPRARWSYGLYARRDGAPLWGAALPADPLCAGAHDADADTHARLLRDALAGRLREAGHVCDSGDLPGALPHRLAYATDAATLAKVALDPRLARSSVHDGPVPERGTIDTLMEDGVYLLALGGETLDDGARAVRLELPALPDVDAFLALVACVATAAQEVGVHALVWTGSAPPVDARVAHTTITPDPAVVEINAAPCADLAGYLAQQRLVHGCAAEVGLAPLRARFDGTLGDSGGGGHLTFGGPSPAESPFLRVPHLLPGLVRFAQRHPALSYLFAVDSLGGSSQSPRADEGLPELVAELALALETLARLPPPDARTLHATLAPFLADHAGNAHRAEINVEKLANPALPQRGELGLVELRALRMAPSPAHAVAVAALLRAVCAHLAQQPFTAPLIPWGARLHDAFALPFFLYADLDTVLAELDAAGLGLGPLLRAQLADDTHRLVGESALAGVTLRVRRAIEYWPLVGDAASQERSAARWVDGSTTRLELVLRADGGALPRGVTLGACGVRVPLVEAEDARGPALVAGLRHRAFVPRQGLHPLLPATEPVVLDWAHAGSSTPQRVTLHAWRPSGGAYDGLPHDLGDARQRRAERVVVESSPDGTLAALRAPPPGATTPHTLDLRWMLPGVRPV
jgi:uncharacterized protein (DUF2126 family)